MVEKHLSVVFVDARADMHIDKMRAEVEKAGARLLAANCRTEDEVIAAARDADGIITRGAFISRRVMESVPKCRVIVRTGVGVDAVDLEAATDLGIPVANVPDFCIEEVSNHAILLLLAVAKKLVPLHQDVRSGQWRRTPLAPMPSVCFQTLGLLAFGNIARATARKARALAMDVMAYDPYVDPAIGQQHGVRLVPLDELLASADYVSNHLPLTAETKDLMGEREFRLMKRTSFFLNTGRGGTVDQAALCRALGEGWIAGAGLDVFANEPIEKDCPLLNLDSVVFTPHSASYSDRSFEELAIKVGQEAARPLRGEWPANLVNPEVRRRRESP